MAVLALSSPRRVCTLGAWLSSAAGTVPGAPAAPQDSRPSAAPPAVVGAQVRLDLDGEVARLAARLETAPRPRSPVRNPFTLERRTRPDVSRETLLPSDPTQAPPAVAGWVPAPASSITLAGVGAERTTTGQLHTAILSADGRVFLSRAGDEVMGRYQVSDVTADAATLLDLQTGQTVHLTLP